MKIGDGDHNSDGDAVTMMVMPTVMMMAMMIMVIPSQIIIITSMEVTRIKASRACSSNYIHVYDTYTPCFCHLYLGSCQDQHSLYFAQKQQKHVLRYHSSRRKSPKFLKEVKQLFTINNIKQKTCRHGLDSFHSSPYLFERNSVRLPSIVNIFFVSACIDHSKLLALYKMKTWL